MLLTISDKDLINLIEKAYVKGACRTPFMTKAADIIKITELYNDAVFTYR